MHQEINPLERLTSMIGLSRFDVAQILDATPGIVSAWLDGSLTPGPRSRERLGELLGVLESLFTRMAHRAAYEWMYTPNPTLEYYYPIDLLRRGDLVTVGRMLETIETNRITRDPTATTLV